MTGGPRGRSGRTGSGAGKPAKRGGARRSGGGSGRGGGRPGRSPRPGPAPAASSRRVALDVLDRIDTGGAYANLVLSGALDRSGLADADRRFVTELVYGTTRRRRACDFLVDRFLVRPVDGRVRNALRLGAYQLAFAGVAPHAAVGETVAVAPRPARGLVNAVLRRVADAPVSWPDEGTRLSVPDWVLGELSTSLGHERAVAAIEVMNEPATVTERSDGYIQDEASQRVVAAVGAEAGERVLDLCAAPGGKATLLARAGLDAGAAVGLDGGGGAGAELGSGAGPVIVAADLRPSRARLTAGNAARTGARLAVVAADGTQPPFRASTFDRVLVDAPCSGLGTLRRRADLRWRVEPEAVARLAALQRRLLASAADLVRPGGTLVYSVCTLTAAESLGVDDGLAADRSDLVPLDPPADPWEPWGRGAILLPQTASTDGMCLFRYRRAV